MWKFPKNAKHDWLELTACCPLGQRRKIKNLWFLDFQLFYIIGNSSEVFWASQHIRWRSAIKTINTVFLLCIKATLICCPLGQRRKIKNLWFLDFQLFYYTLSTIIIIDFFYSPILFFCRVGGRFRTTEMSRLVAKKKCSYKYCRNLKTTNGVSDL